MKYVVSLESVIKNPEILTLENIVITSSFLRALDELNSYKYEGSLECKKSAEEVVRYYLESREKLTVDLRDYKWDLNAYYDNSYEDNKLLKCCVSNGYGLITSSLILKEKATIYNIPLVSYSDLTKNTEEIECSECRELKNVEVGTWAIHYNMCEECYSNYKID